MSTQPAPIDVSTAAPALQRVAEEVHATRQPRAIQRDGETIAVVVPVASKRTGAPTTVAPEAGEGTMERDAARRRLFAPVSADELARRQVLVAEILANRERRVISPRFTADLVHQVREEEYRSYGDRR
jgi:hypothetical protein